MADELDDLVAPAEVTLPEEVTPPVETPSEEDEWQHSEADGLKYRMVSDDRFEWEDGAVTNAAGEVIGDDDAPIVPEPAAKAVAKEPAKPQVKIPEVTQAAQRPIYTRQATKDFVYSSEAMAAIQDARLMDPEKADRMLIDLNEQYNDRIRNLESFADEAFEAELDDLARSAPEAVSGLTRQILRHKGRLTPEQKQTPGMARQILATAIAERIVGDPLTMEEAYVRATGHQKVAQTPTPVRQPRKIEPIEKAQRSPGAGSARRSPTPVRRAGGGGSALQESAAQLKRIYGPGRPDLTDADFLEQAKEMQAEEESIRRSRGARA